MSQPLIAVTANGRITLAELQPGEEVVFLKPALNYGDKTVIQDAALEVYEEGGKTKVRQRVGAANMATLSVAIVKWQGGRFHRLEVSEKSIRTLEGDTTIFEQALQVAQAAYAPKKPLDEEEPATAAVGPTIHLVENGDERGEM